MLAWSLDEPERVGEILVVRGPACVGRGENMADDPAPRIHPLRVRPGYSIPRLPWANARLSRQKLALRPVDDGRLEVRCIGRTPMAVNGRAAAEAVVAPGDLIELRNAAIFLVAERRAALAEPKVGGEPAFEFGGAQVRNFGKKLVAIVDHLDDPTWAARELAPLAQSHVTYGVTAAMYEPVGEALLDTLREACGDSFDERCERLWREAYATITRAMLT